MAQQRQPHPQSKKSGIQPGSDERDKLETQPHQAHVRETSQSSPQAQPLNRLPVQLDHQDSLNSKKTQYHILSIRKRASWMGMVLATVPGLFPQSTSCGKKFAPSNEGSEANSEETCPKEDRSIYFVRAPSHLEGGHTACGSGLCPLHAHLLNAFSSPDNKACSDEILQSAPLARNAPKDLRTFHAVSQSPKPFGQVAKTDVLESRRCDAFGQRHNQRDSGVRKLKTDLN